jgi:biopolymer transport protein ExbD
MSSVGGDSGQDVELNLAPIIDCFVVLIAYLLMTASFISLAFVDVGVFTFGDAAPPPPIEEQPKKDPPMVMAIDMTTDFGVTIKVSGGKEKKDYVVPIKSLDGKSWNKDELEKSLGQIKGRWPEIEEASLAASGLLKYKDIVGLVQDIKKTISRVLVSGG